MPALVGQHSHAILRAFVVVSRSIPGWQCGLNLLERRLVESHTTVIIPFDDRVIFVRLLNCAEFPSGLSEVTQTLDAISGAQFLVCSRGFGERWPLGAFFIRRQAGRRRWFETLVDMSALVRRLRGRACSFVTKHNTEEGTMDV